VMLFGFSQQNAGGKIKGEKTCLHVLGKLRPKQHYFDKGVCLYYGNNGWELIFRKREYEVRSRNNTTDGIV